MVTLFYSFSPNYDKNNLSSTKTIRDGYGIPKLMIDHTKGRPSQLWQTIKTQMLKTCHFINMAKHCIYVYDYQVR